MGNIVTPDQGWLPLPAYGGVAVPFYPWWLNAALAIWALLALLCCWFLMSLFFLRYCCRRWRHRQYDADRKSLRERLFGFGGTKGQQNVYTTHDQSFPTAPLPSYDDFYGSGRPYVTAGAIGPEEENNNIRFLASGLHPITVVSDKTTDDITENIERNIIKNYIINETQNYYVQQDSSHDEYHLKHNQPIQTVSEPTVTTINMAAERITDDPNWEKTNPIEIQHDGNDDLLSDSKNHRSTSIKQANAEIVPNDPSLLQNNIKYEKQPNIYIYQPKIPENDKYSSSLNKKVVIEDRSQSSDDENDNGSTTSEMSGHDSESIYETIRVFTPKKQLSLEDEDEYKTAGIDEVEIEIKDLIHLQKANNTYNDILSSTSQNLMSPYSQKETNQINQVAEMSGEEETVTKTVQTQQIQTSFRQIGQQLDDSAFSILPPSSSIRYEEQPAIHNHQDRQNK